MVAGCVKSPAPSDVTRPLLPAAMSPKNRALDAHDARWNRVFGITSSPVVNRQIMQRRSRVANQQMQMAVDVSAVGQHITKIDVAAQDQISFDCKPELCISTRCRNLLANVPPRHSPDAFVAAVELNAAPDRQTRPAGRIFANAIAELQCHRATGSQRPHAGEYGCRAVIAARLQPGTQPLGAQPFAALVRRGM